MAVSPSDIDRTSGHRSDSPSPSEGVEGGNSSKRGRSGKPGKKRSTSETLDAKTIARLFSRSGKMTKAERLAAVSAVQGIWKDRPDWKGMTSIQIAAELRRGAFSRERHA